MAAVAAGGASLLSAGLQFQSAKTEAGQAELGAKQQELQVVQREADRKDRLASALSTQSALTGAAGIAAFEGSPLTILNDSIEREKVATERDIFQTEISTLATRSAARSRRKSRQASAVLGLLQTGASLGQAGGVG